MPEVAPIQVAVLLELRKDDSHRPGVSECAGRFLLDEDDISSAQKELAGQIERGEVLLNLGQDEDDQYIFVVHPDGRLHFPGKRFARSRFRATSYWPFVSANELVLRVRSEKQGSDHRVVYEVLKMPLNGVSDEQLETVRSVEKGQNVPLGTFGLDPEAEKELAALIDAVKTACTKEGLPFPELKGDGAVAGALAALRSSQGLVLSTDVSTIIGLAKKPQHLGRAAKNSSKH